MESYQRNQRSGSSDEVIFQRLIERPSAMIMLAHDLNTGAPYYVINYDDVSGFTNTVASSGEGSMPIARCIFTEVRLMRFVPNVSSA